MSDGKINLRISDDLLRKLDELRRAEPDLPNRGEMVRRLIERAEVTQEAKAKTPKKKPGD